MAEGTPRLTRRERIELGLEFGPADRARVDGAARADWRLAPYYVEQKERRDRRRVTAEELRELGHERDEARRERLLEDLRRRGVVVVREHERRVRG
jgi:hypothetical protein